MSVLFCLVEILCIFVYWVQTERERERESRVAVSTCSLLLIPDQNFKLGESRVAVSTCSLLLIPDHNFPFFLFDRVSILPII